MTWLTPRQVSPIGGALDTRDLFMTVPALAAPILKGDVVVVDTSNESGEVTTWSPGVPTSAYSIIEEDNTGTGQLSFGVYMVALENTSINSTGKFRLMGVVRALMLGTGEAAGNYAQVVSSATVKALEPIGAIGGSKTVAILHEAAQIEPLLTSCYFNGYGFGTTNTVT